MSRSPIRTMSPPRSAGSTSVSSATRPPVSSSRRAATLRTSSSGSGRRARGGGVGQPVALVVEAGNSAATRGSCSIRPRRTRSRTRLRTGWLRSANTRSAASIRCSSGHRRVGERAHQRVVRRGGGGSVELATPDLDGPVAEPDLEGGLRVAARRGVAAGHQLAVSRRRPSRRAAARSRRGTPRRGAARGRVYRLADDPAGRGEGEVGDLAAELGDRALLLGVDLGGRALAQPLELGLASRRCPRRASPGRPSGRGPGCRSPRGEPPERREALGLGGLPVAARLLGVAQALLDPLPPLVQHPRQRPTPNSQYRITSEDDEVQRGDDDPEQVDLEARRLSLRERERAVGDAARDREQVHDAILPRPLLEDEREDADDDREDAEAFGERGAEDELARGSGASRPGCGRWPRSARPVRMPMPMPGPMTPRAARPAPMWSECGDVLLDAAPACPDLGCG